MPQETMSARDYKKLLRKLNYHALSTVLKAGNYDGILLLPSASSTSSSSGYSTSTSSNLNPSDTKKTLSANLVKLNFTALNTVLLSVPSDLSPAPLMSASISFDPILPSLFRSSNAKIDKEKIDNIYSHARKAVLSGDLKTLEILMDPTTWETRAEAEQSLYFAAWEKKRIKKKWDFLNKIFYLTQCYVFCCALADLFDDSPKPKRNNYNSDADYDRAYREWSFWQEEVARNSEKRDEQGKLDYLIPPNFKESPQFLDAQKEFNRLLTTNSMSQETFIEIIPAIKSNQKLYEYLENFINKLIQIQIRSFDFSIMDDDVKKELNRIFQKFAFETDETEFEQEVKELVWESERIGDIFYTLGGKILLDYPRQLEIVQNNIEKYQAVFSESNQSARRQRLVNAINDYLDSELVRRMRELNLSAQSIVDSNIHSISLDRIAYITKQENLFTTASKCFQRFDPAEKEKREVYSAIIKFLARHCDEMPHDKEALNAICQIEGLMEFFLRKMVITNEEKHNERRQALADLDPKIFENGILQPGSLVTAVSNEVSKRWLKIYTFFNKEKGRQVEDTSRQLNLTRTLNVCSHYYSSEDQYRAAIATIYTCCTVSSFSIDMQVKRLVSPQEYNQLKRQKKLRLQSHMTIYGKGTNERQALLLNSTSEDYRTSTNNNNLIEMQQRRF